MTTVRRKMVAGNWKMNGLRAPGLELAREVAHRGAADRAIACELLICPPATLLLAVGEALSDSHIKLGGQDCHAAAKGAHTGDVSAEMLKDAGCSHVILGHSERRADHGESDAVVRDKLVAARRAGLTGILCVGESETQRDQGAALDVVRRQITASIAEGMPAAALIVAYEPIWAIGTGRTPTSLEIREMHAHIRKTLGTRIADAGSVRILYGGSVKPGNARELLSIADVDGALVGGASLLADDFCEIARSCG